MRGEEEPAGARFWDEQAVAQSVYWTEHPRVREHVNELITGVSWLWPLVALKAGWAYQPWPRAISIGCGTGGLERSVRLLNVATKIEGWDFSRQSVREARRLARAERLGGIRYRVKDCNRADFGRDRFDAAFFHGSMHHLDDPDELLGRLASALRPHGMVYVDDYVGPSRDEWSDDHLVEARRVFEGLPDRLKLRPVNPPFDYTDPTEMVRSSRIRPAMESQFTIQHYKPYWGNLLFPLFCALDGGQLLQPENESIVTDLIAQEEALVAEGKFTDPLFAVMLGQKR